ncbi:endonuclease/exonuclease/phosphatase family protein [Georhizobium sp. MAB10]|uniref:endonuclease/exonuclease/phosphatase family protein n=1 Tax=Georhizobium sp. MAB10 TaxID=3028319 RepID=UPI0038558C2B
MLVRLSALLAAMAIIVGCMSLPSNDRVDGARLRVASLNALYIRPSGPRFEAWLDRREAMVSAIAEIDADIFALQEVETFDGRPLNEDNLQLDFLMERLPSYGFAAIGPPERVPSTQPILYRKDRFRLVDEGFYFYPGQGDPVFPRRADRRQNRYASWALLQPLEGGSPIHVHNFHFDHQSGTRRQEAASRIATEIAPAVARGEPVLVIGDLNALRHSPTAAILRRAGLAFSQMTGPTFHFGTGIGAFPAIDHLLYSDRFEPVGRGVVFRRNYDGQLPSDHHPVVQDFILH